MGETMIIAQWLYTNRQGTIWLVNANGCKLMNSIGNRQGDFNGSQYLSSQKAGQYVYDQTNFRLEFVME